MKTLNQFPKGESQMTMMQLYNYMRPNAPIDTQWGELKASEWMEKERERITADPSRKAEIRTQGDRIALFVSRVAGDEVDRH